MSMTEKEKLQTELKILTLKRELARYEGEILLLKYDKAIAELQNEIDNLETYGGKAEW